MTDDNQTAMNSEEGSDFLQLKDDEIELLVDECSALLRQGLPSHAVGTYQELLDACQKGVIPVHLQPALQGLIEAGLESGRIRATQGAHAEMAANRLYGRMPRGHDYQKSITATNQALTTLQGELLHEINFSARGPGSCNLTISAGETRLTLSIRRGGISVESVDVSL